MSTRLGKRSQQRIVELFVGHGESMATLSAVWDVPLAIIEATIRQAFPEEQRRNRTGE